MKNLKKIAALMLALVVVLAMMTPVFAEGTQSGQTIDETGSITINGVSADTTYEIYKLLDLESYNTTTGAYSYKVNSAWTAFFALEDTLNYFEISADGYVTWKAGEDAALVATFAQKALAYAKANDISPVQSSTNEGQFVITENKGVFSGLELGYYLIDSTMGALCGLTTTNPNASINAKNGKPTIDKQVQEDSTNQWTDKNTADIGQIITFRSTINIHPGAENYVLHDKMSKGLTFIEVVKIEHVIPKSNSESDVHEVPTDKYTVVVPGAEEDCTFEVKFADALYEDLQSNHKLIVTYTAMVNRDAIISGEGNENEAWLDFGEGNETTHDVTKTYTYKFDLVKTDSQNTLIDGASFRIYDAATGGNEIAVVEWKLSDKDDTVAAGSAEDKVIGYRRARSDETGVDIVVTGGVVEVIGLDNGTYYLEEIKAPDGYNKLTYRPSFTIADSNLEATFNNDVYSTGSGVHVVNKSGTMLPETGGIGTTMFYVLGGALVASAVVLLVTRRRMGEV